MTHIRKGRWRVRSERLGAVRGVRTCDVWRSDALAGSDFMGLRWMEPLGAVTRGKKYSVGRGGLLSAVRRGLWLLWDIIRHDENTFEIALRVLLTTLCKVSKVCCWPHHERWHRCCC